ncbi:hypothetical protein [Agaricicola taiwanensis]|nr:hypothetical protein [Agaricicola taiwanensis]
MTHLAVSDIRRGSQAITEMLRQVYAEDHKMVAVGSLEAAISSASYVLLGAVGQDETCRILSSIQNEIQSARKAG